MHVKKDDERLTLDIKKISNRIQKKYRALNHGHIESDELLRKYYKHILDSLETISRKLNLVKTKGRAGGCCEVKYIKCR